MGNHLQGGRARLAGLAGAVAAATVAGVCALPAPGHAAAIVPVSRTGCKGTIGPDPDGAKTGEPDLLDYSFQCNGGITAYTIMVTQKGDPGGTLDDYNPAPMVYLADDRTPSLTESVVCEGLTPSDAINCSTGAYGSQVSDDFFVSGTVDPIQAYCAHLPTTNAKGDPALPGTPAVPTAKVQLLVSDYTGAEDGPFTLSRTRACPSVPKTVPYTITFPTTTH